MSDKEKRNISDTVKILMQLDKQSLLLIGSGGKAFSGKAEYGKGGAKRIGKFV